jgi:hypothetical protein
LCLLPLLLGCKPEPAPVARVHGKVTVNGQPLRGGVIVFAPDEKRGNRGPLSHASIQDDGSYELGAKEGSGASLGWQRITLTAPPENNALVAGMEKYRNPDLSGLTYEVKPGQDNLCDISLKVTGH